MKSLLGIPRARVIVGLLIGMGLLFLVSRFINLSVTIHVLQHNLMTPRGILWALLSGVAFLLAFSLRGIRWKLFLHPVVGNQISTFKAIQIFLVSIFINCLLPIQGGEIAKSLMLKRIAAIPISRSFPTVAMDRSLDLMPALFIITILPLLGIHMDIKLWLVLGLVVGLVSGLIFLVGLAAWKREVAIAFLQKVTRMLPKAIGDKIEGFATNFIDSLLMAASRPRIFLPAILLTCAALALDGTFAMLAFWTIGYYIPFGTAVFGYTVYNMFNILPTPPGQVGSNEAVGLLVFGGLLHLPPNNVIAMFVFSHPWAVLIMFTTAIICLSMLGLTISRILKAQPEESDAEREEILLSEKEEIPAYQQ
jgi:uncharacterized protein (TIRG00374 family)